MVTIGLGRFIWHNLYKIPETERLVKIINFTVVHLYNMQEWGEHLSVRNR